MPLFANVERFVFKCFMLHQQFTWWPHKLSTRWTSSWDPPETVCVPIGLWNNNVGRYFQVMSVWLRGEGGRHEPSFCTALGAWRWCDKIRACSWLTMTWLLMSKEDTNYRSSKATLCSSAALMLILLQVIQMKRTNGDTRGRGVVTVTWFLMITEDEKCRSAKPLHGQRWRSQRVGLFKWTRQMTIQVIQCDGGHSSMKTPFENDVVMIGLYGTPRWYWNLFIDSAQEAVFCSLFNDYPPPILGERV